MRIVTVLNCCTVECGEGNGFRGNSLAMVKVQVVTCTKEFDNEIEKMGRIFPFFSFPEALNEVEKSSFFRVFRTNSALKILVSRTHNPLPCADFYLLPQLFLLMFFCPSSCWHFYLVHILWLANRCQTIERHTVCGQSSQQTKQRTTSFSWKDHKRSHKTYSFLLHYFYSLFARLWIQMTGKMKFISRQIKTEQRNDTRNVNKRKRNRKVTTKTTTATTTTTTKELLIIKWNG